MFRVIYQHNKALCRASERILLSWLMSQLAIVFCKDRLQYESQYTNFFRRRNSYYEIRCSTDDL